MSVRQRRPPTIPPQALPKYLLWKHTLGCSKKRTCSLHRTEHNLAKCRFNKYLGGEWWNSEKEKKKKKSICQRKRVGELVSAFKRPPPPTQTSSELVIESVKWTTIFCHGPHHRGLETYKMPAFISQSKSCLMKFAPVISGGGGSGILVDDATGLVGRQQTSGLNRRTCRATVLRLISFQWILFMLIARSFVQT